jgi:protoporphyrinogen oxidase
LDIVVVGGGLSGLIFAHYAASRGFSVHILESSSRIGGAIHSIPLPSGSFWELGAHTIYSSYMTIIDVLKACNLINKIIPHTSKGYYIHNNGKIVSILSQLNLPMALLGAARMLRGNKNERTVKDYYSKLFGKRNFNKVINPILSAVICQDASEVSAELLLKSRAKDKTVPRSFTFQGGQSVLLESIANSDKITIHYSELATIVEQTSDGYTVKTANGNTYRTKNLAIAVDSGTASLLLSKFTDISELLREIELKQSVAVLFEAAAENYKLKPFSYIISNSGEFRGMVSRDVIDFSRKANLPKYRAATLHFAPEVEYTEAMRKLKPAFGIGETTELTLHVESFTLPKLTPEHRQRLLKLENKLKKIKNFHLLGNFFSGLSMEDCAIRAKSEAYNVQI